MMTEIERELLRAVESLQSAHEQQLRSLQSELDAMRERQQTQYESYLNALSGLRQMFEQSQSGERALSRQVQDLSEQASSLAQQVQRLSAALPQ